jgi:hypothetical protein
MLMLLMSQPTATTDRAPPVWRQRKFTALAAAVAAVVTVAAAASAVHYESHGGIL